MFFSVSVTYYTVRVFLVLIGLANNEERTQWLVWVKPAPTVCFAVFPETQKALCCIFNRQTVKMWLLRLHQCSLFRHYIIMSIFIHTYCLSLVLWLYGSRHFFFQLLRTLGYETKMVFRYSKHRSLRSYENKETLKSQLKNKCSLYATFAWYFSLLYCRSKTRYCGTIWSQIELIQTKRMSTLGKTCYTKVSIHHLSTMVI